MAADLAAAWSVFFLRLRFRLRLLRLLASGCASGGLAVVLSMSARSAGWPLLGSCEISKRSLGEALGLVNWVSCYAAAACPSPVAAATYLSAGGSESIVEFGPVGCEALASSAPPEPAAPDWPAEDSRWTWSSCAPESRLISR